MPARRMYSKNTCLWCLPAPCLGKFSRSVPRSRSRLYLRLMGMIHDRISSVVAFRDTASDPDDSFKYRSISGTKPEVDTVTLFRENARPRGSVSTSTAVSTASTLCRGSPMPMNTTLVVSSRWRTSAPRPPPVRRRACTTCSTICAAVRFFRSPILAVKQNWQFIAHPSCEETHTVVRPSGPVLDGMITDSTTPPPFFRRYSTFRVPSVAVLMDSISRSPSTVAIDPSVSLNFRDTSSMDSKSSTSLPRRYIHENNCAARCGRSPTLTSHDSSSSKRIPFKEARCGSTTDLAPDVEADACTSSVASETLAPRRSASSESTPARSASLPVGETARPRNDVGVRRMAAVRLKTSAPGDERASTAAAAVARIMTRRMVTRRRGRTRVKGWRRAARGTCHAACVVSARHDVESDEKVFALLSGTFDEGQKRYAVCFRDTTGRRG
mmetsp:Transcript_12434/g.52066  ORF Transcript_12434/g.52066 Transcript_12434/m.52066 type:complete len:440 (-) Transcript_12434:948-2267(-)